MRATAFRAGCNGTAAAPAARFISELEVFAGRSIDVPSCFISGASDWGIHQRPGALETMQRRACTQMIGCHLIEGAGHWVQQEQGERVSELLIGFLREAASRQ